MRMADQSTMTRQHIRLLPYPRPHLGPNQGHFLGTKKPFSNQVAVRFKRSEFLVGEGGRLHCLALLMNADAERVSILTNALVRLAYNYPPGHSEYVMIKSALRQAGIDLPIAA